jgi:hypothetical protein
MAALPVAARGLRHKHFSASVINANSSGLPLTAVVMGAGKVLDDLSLLRDVAVD